MLFVLAPRPALPDLEAGECFMLCPVLLLACSHLKPSPSAVVPLQMVSRLLKTLLCKYNAHILFSFSLFFAVRKC